MHFPPRFFSYATFSMNAATCAILCLLSCQAFINAKPNIHHVSERQSCSCGISTPGFRVVGGNQTADSTFPWLVALVPFFNPRRRYCDATLLTSRYVITAYHCLSERRPEELVARIGTYDFNDIEEKGSLLVGFKSFRLYKQNDGFYNDLALGQLDTEIQFSPTIMPICLPPPGTDYTGVNATVAGWGDTNYRGQPSRYPEAVTLPVVSTSECNATFSKLGTIIRENELCAGDKMGTKDSCQGDSGGPLMYFNEEEDRWVLIGVVSFGVGCATKGFYGAYMNISYYTNSLQDNLGNTACVLYTS